MANRGKSQSAGFNRLSDRDMVFDLLATEKQMSHLYDHAIMEATNDNVRDAFIALQQDEQQAARMLFQYLQQQGWYTTGAGRQQFSRKIETSQRLSGGRLSSNTRFAPNGGPRRFEQNPAKRSQRQPQFSRAGQDMQEQHSRPEWNF